MPIMSKSMGPTSAGRTGTTFWQLPVSITGATYHLNAGTLNGKVVGNSPTGFAAFYTKTVQSIFVTCTMGGTPITALSLLIAGENQFGESVSETVSFVATSAVQTVLCYRRVTGCTITAMTGTPAAGDTVSIGYSLVQPRVPMLAKLQSSGSVLAAFDVNQATLASQGALTATTVSVGGNPYERYTILLAATLLTPTTGHGLVIAHIDRADAGL